LIAVATLVKVVFRLVPNVPTTVMIATEIPAAINPYSMAVAPRSSPINLFSKILMGFPFLTSAIHQDIYVLFPVSSLINFLKIERVPAHDEMVASFLRELEVVTTSNPNEHKIAHKYGSFRRGGAELMSDTNLQIAKQQVSEQRMRVLKQQGLVLGLRREGGQRLEEAVELLNSMRDELNRMENRLEQLIFNS
jgi:hypothetical protein